MFLAARKAMIAWSDAMLDLNQRWLQARKRILDPKDTYGTDDLVQDTFATWLLGMGAWERGWNAVYGPSQPSVPMIMLRNPGLVGEAQLATSSLQGALSTTDLVHLSGGAPIPRADVKATVDGNGILTVKIEPRGKGGRDPGQYRGVVFSETAGTPRVVADLVVDITPDV
jgi:hypothetical protein